MRYGNRVRSRLEVATWGKPDAPWWATYRQTSIGLATITATTDSVAHNKGAWSEVFASTSANADFITVGPQLSASGLDTATLIDIGVGASGAEVVVAGDIAIGGMNLYEVSFPLAIPSGSRVAVRSQGVNTSRTSTYRFQLLDTNNYFYSPNAVDVLGSSTTTSSGTTTTNNTFNEIIASTTKSYRSFVIVPSLTTASAANANPLIELAVGAAGSEVVIGSVRIDTTSTEEVSARFCPYSIVGFSVSSGSRLSTRINTQGGLVDVCLIGISF